MTDKTTAEELAALRDEVRELRDREVANEIRELRGEIAKLRAERAAHVCASHVCTGVHVTPWWQVYPYQPTITCGSGVAGSGYVSSTTLTTSAGTPAWGESVIGGPDGPVVVETGYSVTASN